MFEIRVKFLIGYLVAVTAAYVLKKITYNIASNAIKEQRLSSGIFSFFPVEGKRAIDLANGYIRGVNIVFWFVALFFPFLFIISILQGAL